MPANFMRLFLLQCNGCCAIYGTYVLLYLMFSVFFNTLFSMCRKFTEDTRAGVHVNETVVFTGKLRYSMISVYQS